MLDALAPISATLNGALTIDNVERLHALTFNGFDVLP